MNGAPKYDVSVAMVGEDGNAFAIIGRVQKALKAAGVEKEAQDGFREEAFACGSYDDLLQLVMRTVNVE